MKDIAVYTVITDNYDHLKEPLYAELLEEADFFCFTDDKNLKSDYFQVISIEQEYGSPALTNRHIKILSHDILKKYPYTIYVDGCFQIITHTFAPLIEDILKENDLALFKHHNYNRNCIYQEAKAVIKAKKASGRDVYQQMKKYSLEGFPKECGLIEGGVIIRNNQSSRVQAFNQAWWQEVYQGVPRDQLSFNYVQWKQNVRVAAIPGTIGRNIFFKFYPHLKNATSRKRTFKDILDTSYWQLKINMLKK